MIEDANTNLRALGAREGYVVVQPTEAAAPWGSWTTSHYPKVWSFLTTARSVFKINPKRVHVTGYSQGAQMSWTFAYQHADEIASIAPIAFDGATASQLRAAKREVPVLYAHGRTDSFSSFTFSALPQRNAVLSAWNMGSSRLIGLSLKYAWTRYKNAKGTVFEFVDHRYESTNWILQGHCIPGSTDKGTQPGQLFSYACEAPTQFNWGEAVIDFFKAHPMP